MDTLSDRLRFLAARMQPRPKQREIASHCRVTQTTVSQWFSGDIKTLSGVKLLRLAGFFSVHAKWLNEGVGPRDLSEADVSALLAREPDRPYAEPWPFHRLSADDWRRLTHAQRARVEALALEFVLLSQDIDPAPATGTLGR